MAELPSLVLCDALARLLGLQAHAVAEWCRRGVLPASKLGRSWVIRREALLAHLSASESRVADRVPHRADAAAFLRALPKRRRRVVTQPNEQQGA